MTAANLVSRHESFDCGRYGIGKGCPSTGCGVSRSRSGGNGLRRRRSTGGVPSQTAGIGPHGRANAAHGRVDLHIPARPAGSKSQSSHRDRRPHIRTRSPASRSARLRRKTVRPLASRSSHARPFPRLTGPPKQSSTPQCSSPTGGFCAITVPET